MNIGDIFGYLSGNQQASGWDQVPQTALQFVQSTATAGLSDLYHGITKALSKENSDKSILEKIAMGADRAVDPGGAVDAAFRGIGEALPQEVRNIAPAAGGVIGGIVGSYIPVLGTAIGAGIGTGVGSKLKGDSYTTGGITSGIATGAAYAGGSLFSNSSTAAVPASEIAAEGGALTADIALQPLESYAMGGSTEAIADAFAADTVGKMSTEGATYAMEGNTSKIAEYAAPYMVNNGSAETGVSISEILKSVTKVAKGLMEDGNGEAVSASDSAQMFGSTTEISPEQQTYLRRVANTGMSSAAKPKMLYDDWAFNTKKAWSGLSLSDLLKLQNWTKETKQ